MCGGCGGAPPEWAADRVTGPRNRAAVARRLSGVLHRDVVRPITMGWVVSGPTGVTSVCRTFDSLVHEVSIRSGLPTADIVNAGLAESD
ncbi:hypothetical protein [Tsukamurella strandjordii]|uniref:Uncharacterized protein n=1 Tax=Tsukamurella strandjordii TaxID=147577 RepID=A0AA90NLF2_9ACTN|nr:hypothetical protein [Tsukamurella strandjordii]MDP0396634.1 hypothetical protein [Tsukamurella strandjordii]